MDNFDTEHAALEAVNNNALAEAPRINSSALMMDVAGMESLMRVADLMASGRSTVPKHLQGNPADCMAIVMQSMQWGMNPFAVAQKTHLVNGQLGYEAQLVNAVVQESRSITGRFHYEFKGKPPAIECRVGAIIKGETEITWNEWLCENTVTTKNSPLWKTNPRQQMGYLQVKNWARLHTPGPILGIYTPDEFETKAPRHLGRADVVRVELPDALLKAANLAAASGVGSYQKFWADTGKDNRKLLDGEHERLKAIAIDVDKARTVDNTPAPVKTFDEVMALLCAAANIDELYAAGDLVGEVADVDERAILTEKFEEVKTALEAS